MMKAQKIGCILILAVLLLGAGFHGHRMKAYTAESYLVQPGDTLWEIAQEQRPAFVGIRNYVNLMKRVNGMDSDIQPGQIILIPVWKEGEHGV